MANRGFLSKLNSLTSGDLPDNVDLTLRLGSPLYDSQKQRDVVQGNWMTKYQEKMKAFQAYRGPSNNINNVGMNEYCKNRPYVHYKCGRNIIHIPNNIPKIHPPMLGSIDALLRNSREIPKTCRRCGIQTTPLWRKGPEGPQTLCNACGLRYTRVLKRAARRGGN